MGNKKIRVKLTGRNHETAYIKLPGHPSEPTPGVVARMVRLDDVIDGYRGPMVNLDFDAGGVLIGIEILAFGTGENLAIGENLRPG